MTIKELCYALYKEDWKSSHLNLSDIFKTYIDFYQYLAEENLDGSDCCYEDYIDMFGYNGELYSSYFEFINNEYLDKEYMTKLLGDNYLIDLYLKDIKE